jgi:hypothetical protein
METHSLIEPNSWVALRLPNGTNRLLQIVPNMYGSVSPLWRHSDLFTMLTE